MPIQIEFAPVGAVIGLLTLIAVVVQLRLLRKQLQFDSMLKIHAGTRDLNLLAFEHPEFAVPRVSGDTASRSKAEVAAQLWLNQIHLMYLGNQFSLYSPEQWRAFEADIRDFVRKKPIEAYWKQAREFYPRSFQRFLDERF